MYRGAMYCPNCGQQQVSEEMRFCSRCGLALTGLAEWLAGGGLPAGQTSEVQVDPSSPRRKGMRRAAKLMFFSGVLFPIVLVFSLAIDEAPPLIVPVAMFFVALVWMLYARLFSDKTVPLNAPALPASMFQSPGIGSNATRSSLPPATNAAMPPIGRAQVRTNELAQRPSVTENTTRLLDD